MGEVGSSDDRENVKEMRYRFPNELNLTMRATAMRNGGKSDVEILETLRAEMDVVK